MRESTLEGVPLKVFVLERIPGESDCVNGLEMPANRAH